MKKWICVLLSLSMILSAMPAALAAPVRDMGALEVTLEGGVQNLTDLMMSAAVLRGVEELKENEAPAAALVEGVMTVGLYRDMLPAQGKTLTHAEIADLYNMIFTAGEYEKITKSQCPCVTVTENGLDFDFSALAENPAVGAHIYSAEFDGKDVSLLCDLYYTYEGAWDQTPEMLPDDALTWLCHGEVSLRYDPEKPFGYTVNAFKLSDDYQAGMLSDWVTVENTEFEYSVNLPPILGLAEDSPACMVWETADGSARLTVQGMKQDCTFDQMLADFLTEAENEKITEHREFGFFTAVGRGIYEMYVMPEGMDFYYVLTLMFPPEKQGEYTLYAEFITNSFTAWEAVNG